MFANVHLTFAPRGQQLRTSLAALAGATLAAALLLGGAMPAAAQTETEISCAPESVRAGATAACAVSGASPSTRVTLTLLDGGTAIAQASGLADTRGSVVIDVQVPPTSPVGTLTVALAGSTTGFPLTVLAALPDSVGAGDSPSTGMLPTRLPPAGILALGLILLAMTTSRSVALSQDHRRG
jgi:hypothetical protein